MQSVYVRLSPVHLPVLLVVVLLCDRLGPCDSSCVPVIYQILTPSPLSAEVEVGFRSGVRVGVLDQWYSTLLRDRSRK